MNEDIQFLKDLQQQMRYEDEFDYDCQASPRFWTVGDYKWIPTWEGNAQRYSVYIPEWAEGYEVNEFLERVQEDEELTGLALEAMADIDCDYSALEWIQDYVDSNAYLIPEEEVHFIRENTMFLTKEEARRHIEGNRHNYSSKAHTYAMTAWRAPKVERLLNILMNMDWDNVEVE